MDKLAKIGHAFCTLGSRTKNRENKTSGGPIAAEPLGASGVAHAAPPTPQAAEGSACPDLSDVLIQRIATHLDLHSKEILPFSAVCRTWRQVTADPRLWQPAAQKMRLPAAESESVQAQVRRAWAADVRMRAHKPSRQWTIGHASPATALCWSPDSLNLLTTAGNTACITDAASGKERVRIEHEGSLTFAHLSRDGRKLATAANNTVRITDVVSGTELCRVEHEGPVTFLCLSPDGRKIATAANNTVRITDAASGTALGCVEHEAAITGLTWSPNSLQLLTAWDHTVTLSDASGALLAQSGPQALRWSCSWGPGGPVLASASHDNAVCIADVLTHVSRARIEHQAEVTALKWSPCGLKLATVSGDRTVRLVDAVKGETLARIAHDHAVTELTWSPNGLHLAVVFQDSDVHIINAVNGHIAIVVNGVPPLGRCVRLRHQMGIGEVSWSPDSLRLATAYYMNALGIIDAAKDEMLQLDEVDPTQTYAWHPRGLMLATPGISGRAAGIVDAVSGKWLASIEQNAGITGLSWSPDGVKLGIIYGRNAQIIDFSPGPNLTPHDP